MENDCFESNTSGINNCHNWITQNETFRHTHAFPGNRDFLLGFLVGYRSIEQIGARMESLKFELFTIAYMAFMSLLLFLAS